MVAQCYVQKLDFYLSLSIKNAFTVFSFTQYTIAKSAVEYTDCISAEW